MRCGTWMHLFLLALAGSVRAADISGFVRDASDGESLPFVSVYLKGENQGGISNESGYYAITGVPAGRHTIVASLVGYRIFRREIEVGEEDLSWTSACTPRR